MKLCKILIFLISIFFSLKSLDVDKQDLLDAIKANNITFMREYLENGGNPNFIFTEVEGKNSSLLIFAMFQASEEMALLLIEKGADVNTLLNCQKKHYSPLMVALLDFKFSVDFVELLLKKGANLLIFSKDKDFIRSKKFLNIFNMLAHPNVTRQKVELLIKYLFNLFGSEKIIEVALQQKNISLEAIQKLVDNGAKISQNIIEIAKRLKVNKNILNFFKYQINLKKALSTNLVPPLASDLIDLVDQYSHGRKEPTNKVKEKELMEQLDKAICYEDLDFIKKYLDDGGNIELKLKYNKGKATLLGFALMYFKETIADLLIERNAKLENVVTVDGCSDGALSIAIFNKEFSLNLLKKILQKGAKIKYISIKKKFLKTKVAFHLIDILADKNITEEKRNFLFDYLFKFYGQDNILEIAIENKVSGFTIDRFIGMEAKIKPETIEKAKKLNINKTIVAYLEILSPFNNQLASLDFPSKAKALILGYYNLEK